MTAPVELIISYFQPNTKLIGQLSRLSTNYNRPTLHQQGTVMIGEVENL